ncbi:hypothetical protein KP509_33G032100 [Ceratopteris richardii]|uniref:glycerophosphodiester phosphodiesterase n=1 Tax=Ceratopteris richardii TaxID=49495 RepID=A0A8T2QQA4_CERRI|nr:hypothetical protein KP509_33G032000 [Ceratopteris richardii]KAH7285531.1 hypothetical protein KP509_33G032100 [Ceratopteris richardii]
MQIMTCSDIVSSGPSMKHFLKGDPNKDWRSKVTIIGHRGVGKNDVTSALTEGVELRPSIMENTVVSFNTAARSGADFVEFDVQVTKDGCPVIFHDDFIVVNDKETNCLSHRRVGDLTLEEFQQIGYQKDSKKIDKVLYRKTCDGSYSQWIMSVDDGLCTLRDAFEQVLPSVGFNIELKFDDYNVLSHQELKFSIDAILKVVKECCLGRKIFFTSFHPDAAVMLRRHESNHPVSSYHLHL